jgi:putative MATE family efflux protein
VNIYAYDILSFMGAKEDVILQGVVYLKILSVGIPVTLLVTIVVSVFRSIGNTKTPMIITFVSLIINTVLNYALIFGAAGLPQMGVRGSAYATMIAKILNLCLVISFLFIANKSDKFIIRRFPVLSIRNFTDMLKLSIPATISVTSWAIGSFTYAVLFSYLGTKEIVANEITLSIEDLFVMFSFGLGVSGLTIISQKIGANSINNMHKSAKAILKFGLILSLIYIFAFIVISFFIKDIYPDLSMNVLNFVMWSLILFAVLQPIKITNYLLDTGILKGGGDTVFTMCTDILVVFVIGIPSAYILGFVFKYGFYGVCIGRFSEEIVRFIFLFVRYRNKKWYKSGIEDRCASI